MGDEVERKGLGTPATRADIIEKLVKDGFIETGEKSRCFPPRTDEAHYCSAGYGKIPEAYSRLGEYADFG